MQRMRKLMRNGWAQKSTGLPDRTAARIPDAGISASRCTMRAAKVERGVAEYVFEKRRDLFSRLANA